ncbi:MAG: phage tail tape measure protein [Bacteroidaceae bacterium]|nr:phage tail tape measure protein [Bacteroidaceae bacterium]
MAESRTLQILIEAKDNATAELNGLDKQLKSLNSTFKTMAVAGTAVFAGITTVMGISIKSAMEVQSVQNRLYEILKVTNSASQEQVDVLLDQAEALEKVGVMSKENVIMAQSQLATFDLQISTIEKLTPAIMDYVVAEKGMSATTEDVKALTNGLAQALNGNFASLTRVGFVLDNKTKKLISDGTEMERAIALSQVLDSTYKDFNKTATETAEGSLIILQRSLGDITENLGNIFLPIFNDIVKQITPMVNGIGDWIKENKSLVKILTALGLGLSGIVALLGTLGLAIVPITKSIGLLKGAITLLKGALMSLSSIGIMAIITILGTLAVKLLETREQFNSWADTMEYLGLGIRRTFLNIGASIVETWGNVLNALNLGGDSFIEKASQMRREAGYLAIEQVNLQEESAKMKETLDQESESAKKAGNSLSSLGDDTEDLEEKAEKAEKAIRKLYEETVKLAYDYREEEKGNQVEYTEDVVNMVADAQEEKAKLEKEYSGLDAKLNDELIKLKAEAIREGYSSSLAERELELRQSYADQKNDLQASINEQATIISTYAGMQTGLDEEVAERRRYLNMNELEQLTYDYQKKQELAQRNYLIETAQNLLKIQNLKETLAKMTADNTAYTESVIANNQTITKSQEEELAKQTQSLQVYLDQQKQLYASYYSSINSFKGSTSSISSFYSKGSYASGTNYVPETGVYTLHKGEKVVPRGQTGGSGSVSVNIYGGTYLSENVAEQIGNKIINRLKFQMAL